MTIRSRGFLFAVCVALLLAWPAVALAYTYIFNIPVEIKNLSSTDLNRTHKVNVTVYGEGGAALTSTGTSFTLQPGTKTITLEVNTTAPARSYKIQLDGYGADQANSILTLQKNLP